MKPIAALAIALTLLIAIAAQARPPRETMGAGYDTPADDARYRRLESLLATSFKASRDEIGEAIQETLDLLRYHHIKQSDLSVVEDARLLHVDGRTGYADFAFMLEDYAGLRGKGYSRQKTVQLLNRRYDAAYASHRKVAQPPAATEHETPQEQERDRRLTSLLMARFKVDDADIIGNILDTQAHLKDHAIKQSYIAILDDAAQLHSHSRTGFHALQLIMRDYAKERNAGHGRAETVQIVNQRYDAAAQK